MSVVGDSMNRRRSGRNTALAIDEAASAHEVGVKKEEAEEDGNEKKIRSKAKLKRGLADSFLATELRRSKRVKSNNVVARPDEQAEEVNDEEEEAEEKKPKRMHKQKRDKSSKKTDVKYEGGKADESRASPGVKTEPDDGDFTTMTTDKSGLGDPETADPLQAKKLKSYTQFAATRQSPYPDFARPLPAECKLAHKILASLHGERLRPEETGEQTTAPASRAGCGDSASVLDALVRTILSQNTSDANSSRAKRGMDAAYGSSDAWEAIAAGGQAKLERAIATGGLAAVKSRAILAILAQTRARHGAYSLDHLFGRPDDEAMRELLSFRGVGPKTASCVLLFCLRRPSFAVDTHVHRITGLLGWRPAAASRDQAHAHLDARVPDEDKYGLHVLLVRHGKDCPECRAGGKSLGRCELRRAFRKGKVEGEAGEEVKEEEMRQIKAEEDVDDVDDDVKGE